MNFLTGMTFLTLAGIYTGDAGADSPNNTHQCSLISKRTGKLKKFNCLLDPEAVEGPYYLPLNISRSDIREDKEGVPLRLIFIVANTKICQPISNAIVDIWHADAMGSYSGVSSEQSKNTTFLRGVQTTNTDGEVIFQTIYPGWYAGRSIHIHIEVFLGGSLKHTGQLFFQNSTTDAVRNIQPYASRMQAGDEPLANEADHIYMSSGGQYTKFTLVGSLLNGYTTEMVIGVNPDASSHESSSTTVRPTWPGMLSGAKPTTGGRPSWFVKFGFFSIMLIVARHQ